MKDSQVKEILFDLYMIDDSLKSYENELKDIILEIHYSRPDTEFNESFKQNLKEEILLKIKSFKRDNLNRKINLSNDLPKESNVLIFMKKINYILGGASVSTLVIFAAAYFMINSGQISIGNKNNQDNKNTVNTSGPANTGAGNTVTEIVTDNKLAIKNIGKNAFGAISISTSGQESSNGQTIPGTAGMTNPSIDSKVTEAKMMSPYNQEVYNYLYKDSKEKLAYDTTGLEVLKRVYSSSGNFNPSSVNIGNVNLSSFKNLKLNNIALDEDKENGYSIYYNFNDGSLSINRNYQKWPVTDYNKQIKISDIPSNDSIIKIANDFVTNYGIDTKNYGAPEVTNEWKTYYEQSTDKENYYFPTSMSVVYPLIINGKSVYESYGNKVGMTVNVDITLNKVDGVYGLQSQDYESSKYDLETDTVKLLEAIRLGGDRYIGKSFKDIFIDVKNPSIGYVRSYKYENNMSYELFVPAMILDIENTATDINLYKKNVIIPLTKDAISEIITKNNDQKNDPITPEPAMDIMPLKR